MEEKYDLAGQVIGCAMKVHRILGPGFLESVYQNALVIEIRSAGLKSEEFQRIPVTYEGNPVGDFVADMIVEKRLIVEIKATSLLVKAHEVQLVNYLTATGHGVGVLLNFGTKSLEYRKKFHVQNKKPSTTPSAFC